MRKKVNIVWVLVVIMVLSMVGCSNAPNTSVDSISLESKESYKLEFEPRGIYVLAAFGEEFSIYRFGDPNTAIVVYKTIDGIYLVGEDGGEKGMSYGNIFMPDREFIALSSEYLLFESEEGKIAVSIERRKNVKRGESFYYEYSFEELSDEEKDAFVYPVECEEVEY